MIFKRWAVFMALSPLMLAAPIARAASFEPLRSYEGDLEDADYADLYLTLYRGNEYRITGSCDLSCSDLDLTLYAFDSSRQQTDDAYDDVPSLQFTVNRTQQFRLRVKMVDCNRWWGCHYQVDVATR